MSPGDFRDSKFNAWGCAYRETGAPIPHSFAKGDHWRAGAHDNVISPLRDPRLALPRFVCSARYLMEPGHWCSSNSVHEGAKVERKAVRLVNELASVSGSITRLVHWSSRMSSE